MFSCIDILNHKSSALFSIFYQIISMALSSLTGLFYVASGSRKYAHFKSVEGSRAKGDEISTEIKSFFDIFNQDHSLTFSIRSVDGIRVFSFLNYTFK